MRRYEDATAHALALRAKIEELAALRVALTEAGFRANLPGYPYLDAVRAPVLEERILAAEQRLGVRLPDGYRAFLKHVGDGGMGPVYELFSLDDPVDGIVGRAGGYEAVSPARLGRPFQLQESVAEIDPADPWFEVHGYDAYGWQGLLCIGDWGCTVRAELVVSGPLRGAVWITDHPRADPERDHETGANTIEFLDWYEQWLNGVLSDARSILSLSPDINARVEVFQRDLMQSEASDAGEMLRAAGIPPEAITTLLSRDARTVSEREWEALAQAEPLPASWLEGRQRVVVRCECGASSTWQLDDVFRDGDANDLFLGPDASPRAAPVSCATCSDQGWVVTSRPRSIAACLALVSQRAKMPTAEALTTELIHRLELWERRFSCASVVPRGPWWRWIPRDGSEPLSRDHASAAINDVWAGLDDHRLLHAASVVSEFAAYHDTIRKQRRSQGFGATLFSDWLTLQLARRRHARLRGSRFHSVSPQAEGVDIATLPDLIEPMLALWELGFAVERIGPDHIVLASPEFVAGKG